MQRYSSLAVSTLFLSMALGQAAALAGPVQADVPTSEPATALAEPPTGPLAPLSPVDAGPSSAASLGGRAASASADAGSALAAELMREAGAGAAIAAGHAAGSAQQAQRPADSATGHPAPQDNDFERGIREFGKATVSWLKDTLPWMRSDDDQTDAQTPFLSGEWSGHSRFVISGARAPLRADNARTPDLSSAPGDYERGADRDLGSGDGNVVRAAISTLKQVLEHPMTWLVISLFVIGGIAVSVIDRRPK